MDWVYLGGVKCRTPKMFALSVKVTFKKLKVFLLINNEVTPLSEVNEH